MKKGPIAIATLLYSPDYLPGVFTLIAQLNKLLTGKKHLTPLKTVLFVTPQVFNDALSEVSRDILKQNFDQIIQINPSNQQSFTERQNKTNLDMLQRPELALALIKARLWEHTEFNQILYLDADTLPLNDTLFDVFDLTANQSKHQIGAAPDIGWPDMFNSGVMTIVPDYHIAADLNEFIIKQKSIDGADQGILNQFFNPKCGSTTENDWIVLPFLYNVTTPNNGYQCPPAMKYFKDQIKLIHFIGKHKPWKEWHVEDINSNEYSKLWHDIYNDFAQQNNISNGSSYSSAPIESDGGNDCNEQARQEEQNNLHSNTHPESNDELETKTTVKEKEKSPTPIQLPLDFKEWLTTFIEKDDTSGPENQPDSQLQEPTPEPELDSQSTKGPIKEKLESKTEPVGIYHFGWEGSSYLNKVERAFPGDIFAYETKLGSGFDQLTPQTGFELETTSDFETASDVETENISTQRRAPSKTQAKHNTQPTTSRLQEEADCDDSETASDQAEENEREQLHKSIIAETREEKKNHKKKKSVSERLSEITAHIDFGLQDYIDIGGSDDEADAAKYKYVNVIDKGTGTHPTSRG